MGETFTEHQDDDSKAAAYLAIIAFVVMSLVGCLGVIYKDWRRERLLEYIIADTRYVMFISYQNEAIANFNCNNSDELNVEISRRGQFVNGARVSRDEAVAKLERWW